jgi:endonuclease/exonuclease/phosphatase family metal-dependent hydrolase
MIMFLLIASLLISPLLPVSAFAGTTEDSSKITVMSFNIQSTSAYYADNKQQMVVDLIHENNVDIVGIQELHYKDISLLGNAMPDYNWFGVGRDDGKTTGEMGPILYSTQKLELLDNDTFWLSETPDEPGSSSWGAACTRIATWGKFRDKRNEREFYFFNTHLDHVSSEARTKGSELLQQKITEMCGSNPVVLTGDFNYTESATGYNLLTTGKPGFLKLYDAKYLSETASFGPSGSYNGYNTPNPGWKIDFIFGNFLVKVFRHGILDDRPNGIYISDHYPVLAEIDFHYPQPPLTPSLTAVPGDGMVMLTWDDVAETETREPFADNINDFEGYKLYRSTDKEMSDAVIVAGGWETPRYREPIFQCDLVNDRKGFTDYGIENGLGYDLGQDSGLQHFFKDVSVWNGQTYYYVLTAYDYGIPTEGKGFPPRENSYFIHTDQSGHIEGYSKNIAIATPYQKAAGYIPPTVHAEMENKVIGTGMLFTDIADFTSILPNHVYKIKFHVDTLLHLRKSERFRHPSDLLYVNDGFSVYDVTNNDALVYSEGPEHYSGNNLLYNKFDEFWYFNTGYSLSSDVFHGIKVNLDMPVVTAGYDPNNSGWITGDAPIQVTVSTEESAYFPWQYDIVFTGQSEQYKTRNSYAINITNQNGEKLTQQYLLLDQSFDFYVVNTSFPDSVGNYEMLDLVVYDVNTNGQFDRNEDYILAGHVVKNGRAFRWAGTVFCIDFFNIKDSSQMPRPNDVYHVDFKRPFVETDSILFKVNAPVQVDKEKLNRDMNAIKVVPNPVFGQSQNVMFTHIPAQCTIKIFTVSGVCVRDISVNNPAVMQQTSSGLNSSANGTAFWDLKNKSGQNVAPGCYIFYVESKATGNSKIGKFAVIR